MGLIVPFPGAVTPPRGGTNECTSLPEKEWWHRQTWALIGACVGGIVLAPPWLCHARPWNGTLNMTMTILLKIHYFGDYCPFIYSVVNWFYVHIQVPTLLGRTLLWCTALLGIFIPPIGIDGTKETLYDQPLWQLKLSFIALQGRFCLANKLKFSTWIYFSPFFYIMPLTPVQFFCLAIIYCISHQNSKAINSKTQMWDNYFSSNSYIEANAFLRDMPYYEDTVSLLFGMLPKEKNVAYF